MCSGFQFGFCGVQSVYSYSMGCCEILPTKSVLVYSHEHGAHAHFRDAVLPSGQLGYEPPGGQTRVSPLACDTAACPAHLRANP